MEKRTRRNQYLMHIQLFLYLIFFLFFTSVFYVYGKTTYKKIFVEYRDISIFLNNQKLDTDLEPFIFNGRTFIPIRNIPDFLNKKVTWDGELNRIDIKEEVPTTTTNSKCMDVTAIATVVLAIFAIIQSIALWFSFKESSKIRSATVLMEVNRDLLNLRDDWHKLYHLTDIYYNKALADKVCVELQRVAYLCMTNMIDKKTIIMGYGKVFTQCWEKLENFVKDYREECGEPREIKDGGLQREHLELFAQICDKEIQKELKKRRTIFRKLF